MCKNKCSVVLLSILMSMVVYGAMPAMHIEDESLHEDELLHEAARAGDAQGIRMMLEGGGDLAQAGLAQADLAQAGLIKKDEEGDTPLHVAVRCKQPGALEAMLKYGGDRVKDAVSIMNRDLSTPLHVAEEYNSIECAEVLLRYLKVEAPDEAPKVINMIGVRLPYHGVVRRVINATALHMAAMEDRADMVRVILGEGGEVARGDLKIGCINSYEGDGSLGDGSRGGESLDWTPLHVAIMNVRDGDFGVIRAIMELGGEEAVESLFMGDVCGYTPLHLAAYLGYAGAIDIMVKGRGHRASQAVNLMGGCLDGVPTVYGAPAVYGVSTVYGVPPLFCAIAGFHVDVVEKLVELGADKNACSESGMTVKDLVKNLGVWVNGLEDEDRIARLKAKLRKIVGVLGVFRQSSQSGRSGRRRKRRRRKKALKDRLLL